MRFWSLIKHFVILFKKFEMSIIIGIFNFFHKMTKLNFFSKNILNCKIYLDKSWNSIFLIFGKCQK